MIVLVWFSLEMLDTNLLHWLSVLVSEFVLHGGQVKNLTSQNFHSLFTDAFFTLRLIFVLAIYTVLDTLSRKIFFSYSIRDDTMWWCVIFEIPSETVQREQCVVLLPWQRLLHHQLQLQEESWSRGREKEEEKGRARAWGVPRHQGHCWGVHENLASSPRFHESEERGRMGRGKSQKESQAF